MDERDIERYLIGRTSLRGGEVRKVKWIGRNSAPDRRVMLPGNTFWAEIKRTGKGPTSNQAREHTRMRRAGERVEVVNSIERVDELIP